jgi:cyclic beta-1,2-glucan synthetase
MRKSRPRLRGILVAVPPERASTLPTLWKLCRAGLWNGVVIQRNGDRIQVWGFSRRRVLLLWAVMAGLTGGLLGSALHQSWLPPVVPAFVFALAAVAVAGSRRAGVGKRHLSSAVRWVLPDETLVLIESPLHRMDQEAERLAELWEHHPVVLLLHPPAGRAPPGSSAANESLSAGRLGQHAGLLAARHRVGPAKRRGAPHLDLLDQCKALLEKVAADLAGGSRMGQEISPAAEWLLDNAYIIETQIDEVRRSLPRSYYHKLPVLVEDEEARNVPRVSRVSSELVGHTDFRVGEDAIHDFLSAYQSVSHLSMGELWAMPSTLRIALIHGLCPLICRVHERLREREQADFWANRLLASLRRGPGPLMTVVAEMARALPQPGAHFAVELIGHLHDEDAALMPVQSWLEQSLKKTLADIVTQDRQVQTEDRVSIANAVGSLREFSRLDWRSIFEGQSRVEAILTKDPAAVYAGMRFATRDDYRHAVERMALRSGSAEEEVAGAAVDMARSAEGGEDGRLGHVGFYLVGGGRAVLEKRVRYRPSLRERLGRFVHAHPAACYLTWIGSVTAVVAAVFATAGSGTAPFLTLLALVPASELAVESVNFILSILLPPRPLPAMDFKELSPEHRTLVVVPMMLLTPDSIRTEAEKLAVRHLANPDPNLLFALFADYCDAPEQHTPDNRELLRAAVLAVEDLNDRYGRGRFFLLHRERAWSDSEQHWIGRERKRGKLEDLNALIAGEAEPGRGDLVRVGDPEDLETARYVITLDSDTELPRGSAMAMVEAIAHPLNAPRLARDGRSVQGGYTIIQPRISTSLPSAMATRFSRMHTGPVGIDPYSRSVSDVYMDLAGETSYMGKGIYDPRVFHRCLSGRFPAETLLSHDLIEGCHVGTGFAAGIELFDDFPATYGTWRLRQHRWIRGDWQIALWTGPRVPIAGGWAPNPLSALSRWKIYDNLRRSLVAPAALTLLSASWLLSAQAAPASVLVALLFLFPSLAQALHSVRPGAVGPGAGQAGISLSRCLVNAALLPDQALLAADAIIRSCWRSLVSRRCLLEWTTAQDLSGPSAGESPRLVGRLALLAAGAVGFGVLLGAVAPASLAAAAGFVALWTSAPLLVWHLGRPGTERRPRALSESSIRWLRRTARRTWRYFDEFVGDDTGWLPPDNFQVSFRNELAMRTSPTNIGMWLLSALGAYDFGYLTLDDFLRRITATIDTMEKMERYRGHLLNWYEIPSLQPLPPRYVSTVDSGNLLACLWTLEQGLNELLSRPVLGPEALQGLGDTLALVREGFEEAEGELPGHDEYRELRDLFRLPKTPVGFQDIVRSIGRAGRPAAALLKKLESHDAPDGGEALYWARQLTKELASWRVLIRRYLGWEQPGAGDAGRGASLSPPRRAEAQEAPSLRDLASGTQPVAGGAAACEGNSAFQEPMEDRLDRAAETFQRSCWFAGEMLAAAEGAIRRIHALGDEMDMRFLYHEGRRLFMVGYNVTEEQADRSYYDFLMSEARVASFLAVARSDVRAEHWAHLARPFGTVYGRRVLMSWTGTMFEYMMPALVNRLYSGSLIEHACRAAVDVQIAHGRRHAIPWGFSESAFSALDAHRTYQYRAFGVPGLGLKRGLEDDLVAAPYATFLALPLRPRAAIRNLGRLADAGLMGAYGMYEAIDFSRRTRGGRKGAVIRTYMGHHQAMSFLSMVNLLHGDAMPRRFHSDLRVRSAEPLLFERIPVTAPVFQGLRAVKAPAHLTSPVERRATSRFDTPHTATPKVQLLSNGRYAVMLTNAGGGYQRWKDVDITRWRSDATRDNWGTFCYLRDSGSGEVWSAAYHPTGKAGQEYAASFSADRALFRRMDNGIETVMEVAVSPEDDAEVRKITLINRSAHRRRLEVTTCSELALAPHRTDRAHPAFGKLFVRTEAVAGLPALVATRRRRGADEPEIWAAQVFAAEHGEGPAQYETSREEFVGRGRTVGNPAALERKLTGRCGDVLDPIFSLRQTIVLEAGGRERLCVVTAAGDSRDAVMAMVDKYASLEAAQRAFELAWTHAQVELSYLRVRSSDVQMFQQLAGHLLYPGGELRAASGRLRRNRLGQDRLWAHGLSGDLPIVTVTIGDVNDGEVIRELLLAHTYWRMHGLSVDLVILCEERSDYGQPLRERLQTLVQAHSVHTGTDKTGGVFLRNVDQIPGEELTLILASARVALIAARGSLRQQLSGTARPEAEFPAALSIARRPPEYPSQPLPFLELPYFNGFGGFTPDGREYAVYLGPGRSTPAPWVNVMSNPSFGALVSESGSGFAWYGNSQNNRLTGWSNDPVCDPPSQAIYIRDEESGVFWTPTPLPIREMDAYRARHGAGYTVFEHNSHGIEQELVLYVPLDEEGGDPLLVERLRLRNRSPFTRRLQVTFYAEWTLGEDREDTQRHVVTEWDSASGALFARNRYHPDHGSRVAFAALSPRATTYTADRTEFLGRNRAAHEPAALGRSGLAQRTGTSLDPCAALQKTVVLPPGAMVEVTALLGQAGDAEEARRLVRRYSDSVAVEDALRRTRERWDALLGTVQVTTPVLSMNFLLNRWLLYQALSCRVWGRSGFYQSSGAFGFRDQLQDAMALVYSAPALTRDRILDAASRQFVEGDVQHWWHEPGGAGIRSRCSDDLLWLPFVTAHYVRVTGDENILDEAVPFLQAELLKDGEQEAYNIPRNSDESAPLLEHCRRAVERGLTAGPHGLPLIGSGDWNDGMNRVGVKGKGESVWLGWFLVRVLKDYAELCEHRGREEEAAEVRQRGDELTQTVEDRGWDGEWYLRAFFDDGTPLGSAGSVEARIDSLPQSWAVLSGAGEGGRARRALSAAWEHLVRSEERLVLLFTPPFEKILQDPGYIKAYPPGVRENGGQYTHGALWLAQAFAVLGDGERAVRLLTLLSPVEHARTEEEAMRYAVEPYVAAADVYAMKDRVGRGGWTWYTGSAGWMYRVWLEEVLGFRLRGDRLSIRPAIPPAWDGCTLTYRHRSATYEIAVENPGAAASLLEIDGKRIEGMEIALVDDGRTHRVRVIPEPIGLPGGRKSAEYHEE